MSTKLVFGWSIDYNGLINYLEKNKAGSCKDNQCVCGPKCWDNIKYTFPKDVYFINASNYATSEFEFDYAISLLPTEEYYTVEDITCVLNCKHVMEVARELMLDLGIYKTDRPKIFTLLNI